MEDVDSAASPMIPTESGHPGPPHEVQVKVEVEGRPSPAEAMSPSTVPFLPQSQETEV